MHCAKPDHRKSLASFDPLKSDLSITAEKMLSERNFALKLGIYNFTESIRFSF